MFVWQDGLCHLQQFNLKHSEKQNFPQKVLYLKILLAAKTNRWQCPNFIWYWLQKIFKQIQSGSIWACISLACLENLNHLLIPFIEPVSCFDFILSLGAPTSTKYDQEQQKHGIAIFKRKSIMRILFRLS